jgi:hypothetical protein
MKDIEMSLWFDDFPDYLNDITINLPFLPIVGDHIDFIFDKKPDWLNATPEQWEAIDLDYYVVTKRIFGNSLIKLEIRTE